MARASGDIMSYCDRRAMAMDKAQWLDGWGCIRLSDERHVGRVLMARKYGFRPSFYPVGTPEYNMINTSATSFQRALTSRIK